MLELSVAIIRFGAGMIKMKLQNSEQSNVSAASKSVSGEGSVSEKMILTFSEWSSGLIVTVGR